MYFIDKPTYALRHGSKKLYLNKNHVKPLAYDPRYLIVLIDAPHFRHVVVVAHAPHMHRPEAERHDYWHNLTKQLLTYPPSFLLIDANARLGSITSPTVGDMGWCEEENDNGTELRCMLETTNLYAVNTLLPNEEGYTWTVRKGGPYRRIDYIAVSEQIFKITYDVSTQRDYDRIHPKEDHTPVVADFMGVQKGTTKAHNGFRYDKTALRDPTIAEKFGNALNKLPLPDWETNINDHFEQTTRAILETARDCYRETDVTPK